MSGRRGGRVAEGGGLLNRYRLVKAYRGFESLRLRHFLLKLLEKLSDFFRRIHLGYRCHCDITAVTLSCLINAVTGTLAFSDPYSNQHLGHWHLLILPRLKN